MIRLIALLLLIPSLLWAYTPPKGIPDPADHASWEGFGEIDQTTPSSTSKCPSWSSDAESDNCYYIDNTNHTSTCTDSPSNRKGKPLSPRCTIPDSITYAAGSYIEVHGDGATGDHKYTQSIKPYGVGTASNPIWWVGIDKPIINNVDIGFSGVDEIAWMVFDGFAWRSTWGMDIRPRDPARPNAIFHHFLLRNLDMNGGGVSGTSALGVGTYGNTGSVTDVVIYNSLLTAFGDKDAPAEECATAPQNNVTRFWILNNEISHCAEDGIGGSPSGKRTTDYFYIGGNYIHDNITNGIDVKQVKHLVISENDISGAYGNTPKNSSGGDNCAIVIHYSENSSGALYYLNYTEDASIIFNKIYNSSTGLYFSGVGRTRVIGNLFYNINHVNQYWDEETQQLVDYTWNPNSVYATGSGIHVRGMTANFYIVNNTFYDVDIGITFPDNVMAYNAETEYYKENVASYNGVLYRVIDADSDAGITGVAPSDTDHWEPWNVQIWGNIFAARPESTGSDVYILSSIGATTLFDRNLFYSTGGPSFRYGNSTQHDLDWLVANTTFCSDGSTCFSTDPKLSTDSVTYLQLQVGSAAIGTSTEGPTGDSVYDDFNTQYSISIKKDYTGTARPQQTTWDIGAYEYDPGTVHPVMSISTGAGVSIGSGATMTLY